jgi:hypothetical protein
MSCLQSVVLLLKFTLSPSSKTSAFAEQRHRTRKVVSWRSTQTTSSYYAAANSA